MAFLRFLPQPLNSSLSTDFLHHHHRLPYPQQQQQHRLNFAVVKTTALSDSHPSRTLLDSKTQVFDAVPLLSSSQAYERMKAFRENIKGKQQYLAMYSSIFGGITTDPAVMIIPMDDHMVHRGHGVFDTAAIMDGYLYELDQHLDRFLNSASRSKIDLPFDRESIRRILIQTVSASKCRNGSLRYWLSAGPGDFNLSPSGCHQSVLYAIVIQDMSPAAGAVKSRGVKVITSSIPIKHPKFAITKSVNYLPNVLSKMEAEEAGAFAGIWLDDEGFVAEGPNMNVAFVTKEKELIMPHFDKILSGCTAKRVLTLAERLIEKGKLRGIRKKNVTVEEGKKADEMMLLGSGVLVCPVVQWDEKIFGDGKPGDITEDLLNLIVEDMKSSPSIRTSVLY
ncbi:unnamed protein product [Lathyrus oleraceus]|uniref:Uncharacterized protein n=1 Tax=Pisum sativum TaxID=3888 RepID=A0A9D5A3U1_PEA|nr:D-amino-acid transaminase, chloroplastic isoform X1 [Pisum sativum]KAI5394206.1 hypothetical protein KIW84_061054 [Pisum sativum]